MGTASESGIKPKTFRRLRRAYSRLKDSGNNTPNVSSLAEEADISRAAFYMYYENFDEFEKEIYSYVVSLFIRQIEIFLATDKNELKEVTKRKNLIFAEDDFHLFGCLFSKTKGFEFGTRGLELSYKILNETVEKNFDKKYIKKNKSRLDLFFCGYMSVMRENFLDYHSGKVYRDMLRTMEIWEYLFPEHKFKR